jgi:hypothetical protein
MAMSGRSKMTRYLLPIILGMLAMAAVRPTLAENLSLVQYQDPSILVGTWRSGNFAYQFNPDGTYVYVGAVVTPEMQSRLSEQGFYSIEKDQLIIYRESGIVYNTMNDSNNLAPETRILQWRVGYTQVGLGLELLYPEGPQIFQRQ